MLAVIHAEQIMLSVLRKVIEQAVTYFAIPHFLTSFKTFESC